MNDKDLGYTSSPQDDYEKKQRELNSMVRELYKDGISADVHMDPLVMLKCYIGSEKSKQLFYELISEPDDGLEEILELLDAVLSCFAGRLESISRPGLLKSVICLNEPIPYCTIQMQPLVSGPPVMGLDEIFGEDVVNNILTDFSYIPMDKDYVCCGHHHGKIGGSKMFLVGDRIRIENIIPELYEISENTSIEDICPYESECALKKVLKAQSNQDIKLLHNPLENALLVFQKRIEASYGPEMYAKMSKLAEEIVDLSEKSVKTSYGGNLSEPAGYR